MNKNGLPKNLDNVPYITFKYYFIFKNGLVYTVGGQKLLNPHIVHHSYYYQFQINKFHSISVSKYQIIEQGDKLPQILKQKEEKKIHG